VAVAKAAAGTREFRDNDDERGGDPALDGGGALGPLSRP
jgi:hypothetical protein